MIIDVLDHSAVHPHARDELGKCYPNAKIAQLKVREETFTFHVYAIRKWKDRIDKPA